MFTLQRLMQIKAMQPAQLAAFLRSLSATQIIELRRAAMQANNQTAGMGSLGGLFDRIIGAIGQIAPAAGGLISLIPGGQLIGAGITAIGSQLRPAIPVAPTPPPIVTQPPVSPQPAASSISPATLIGGAALLLLLARK